MSTSTRDDAAPGADHHADAIALWREGRRDEALDAMRRAVGAGLDPETLNDFGVVAADALGPEVGRAVFDTLLAIDPGHDDARANRDALAPAPEADGDARWRTSPTLGGPDPDLPERAFPGMPAAGVMREHALRYSFALDVVAGAHVLDLGCGTGYGSEILSWTAASVRGFDLWRPGPGERPRWPGGARLTYGHDLCTDPLPPADVAVMYEVIEHLEDAPAALRRAWSAVDTVVASFPNPVFHGSHHNPYHVNDWPLEQFERELADAASVRFGRLAIEHWRQDYRDGSRGTLIPGREPESSYWVVVARGLPA